MAARLEINIHEDSQQSHLVIEVRVWSKKKRECKRGVVFVVIARYVCQCLHGGQICPVMRGDGANETKKRRSSKTSVTAEF